MLQCVARNNSGSIMTLVEQIQRLLPDGYIAHYEPASDDHDEAFFIRTPQNLDKFALIPTPYAAHLWAVREYFYDENLDICDMREVATCDWPLSGITLIGGLVDVSA
jgi:hypothetical protein